jgi:hypothetical protein
MTALLQRLTVAADDTERAALLEAASAEELARLSGDLAYRSLIAESSAAVAACDAFSEALAEAPDDEARLKVIAQARAEHGGDWLAEWTWWRTATPLDASSRWQELMRR